MDPRFGGPTNEFQWRDPSWNGLQLIRNQSMAEFPDGSGPGFATSNSEQKLVNVNVNGHGEEMVSFYQGIAVPGTPPAVTETEDEYADDCDFSDAVLRYIDYMLMEEDIEDKTHMLQESLDFQAKEKSFYEVLGKKYPPSPQLQPQQPRTDLINHGYLNLNDGQGRQVDCDDSLEGYFGFRLNGLAEEFSDSPISPLQMRDMLCNDNQCQSVWNFKKGVEEARKLLPGGGGGGGGGGTTTTTTNLLDGSCIDECLKREKIGTRGKKTHAGDIDLDRQEGRSSKLSAVAVESNLPMEEFDDVLLHTLGESGEKFAAYRDDLRDAASQGQVTKPKGSSRGKGRGKKQGRKKQVIDLRTLLINCAQAVAADDCQNANELLKQIRQHSSPLGDGNQRLAYYFADGLEARLAGTGSQIHKALVNKRTTAAEYLRAYYTYLASSPFRKISNFASNKTIMIKSAKAMRVHVIDFGILYGFQWPTFLQRIAERKGGPPTVRITGIDFPQPGFRPAERIQETGRRLAHYAKMFDVPFEYNAIAQSWETIRIEDLKIDKDEFVVVNCLYRTKNLLDETVVAESARTKVLNLIRKIDPNVFIHGIVNGAYSAPFFVTRFREVLFHFSAMFDMLETNIPRERAERRLIERDIFGKEALNVIACEGWERTERPETYKQWQVRDMRAGFVQVGWEREMMERARHKVRAFYHKDFLIDQDGSWLLMGWKGRIVYAISCWKPASSVN
ncbi:scarecrow-like protein 9 [Andrographis paniculata]|uniref:scarecrow-like protein 9 n=1 Tax=Andrographis paniculata TaxID=175694 RepID=UPI0021E95356|nr:scarecrow-like protein 9 [Andrographis paniculata]